MSNNHKGAGRRKEVIDLQICESADIAILSINDKSATGNIELMQRLYKMVTKRQANSARQRSKNVV